jgi:hypothetical protein
VEVGEDEISKILAFSMRRVPRADRASAGLDIDFKDIVGPISHCFYLPLSVHAPCAAM